MTPCLVALFLAAATPEVSGPLRHRAEAELAERQGDPEAAERAAARYLDAAGVTALTAAWSASNSVAGGDHPEERRLREAVAFVIPLAARHANRSLLVRALGWSPSDIEAHRDELPRALIAAPHLSSFLPESVLASLAAADPRIALALARNGTSARVPAISVTQAREIGAPAIGWLEEELDRALAAGDREAMRRAAEALAAGDSAQIPALLTLDLLQEDPRRLRRAGLEIADLVGASAREAGQTLIRLHRALAREPDAGRMTLALAWRQLEGGLPADARREAQQVLAGAAASREARQAAAIIDVLAALDLGQGAVFAKWLAARGDSRSPFITARVLRRFGYDQHLPDEVRAARRQLLAQLYGRSAPPRGDSERSVWAWLALKDGELDDATRRHALEAIVEDEPDLGRVARSCSTEHLSLGACVRRAEAANSLRRNDDDDDDDGGPEIDVAALPAALGTDLDLAPSWLERLATLPPEKLVTLAPWIDRQRTRPVARTSAFAILDVFLHFAKKDARGGQRALDEALPRLEGPQRLALRLLTGDLDRKVLAPDRVAASYQLPAGATEIVPGAPSTEPEPTWLREAFTGKDRLTILRRGLAYLQQGRGPQALQLLRPLQGELSGCERGELAAYVYLAARAAGDASAARAAARDVTTYAPGSDFAARLAATEATAAGDGTAAESLAARWLALSPDSDAAQRAYLEAIAARKAGLPPGPRAREMMERAGRLLRGAFTRPGAVGRATLDADAACWRLVLTKQDDLALASTCSRAVTAAVTEADPQIVFGVHQRLDKATDAASVVRAARTLALLHEIGHGWAFRARPAWLWFVAGDLAKSRAALGGERRAGERRVVADDDEPLRILLGARPSGDPLRRRALYRRFEFPAAHPAEDAEADLDLDLTAAARNARDPRDRGSLFHLGCLAATPGMALANCGQAWRNGQRTAGTASRLADAVFAHVEEARKEGFEAKRFLDQARAALGERLPGTVAAHEAEWLLSLGEFRKAARAAEEAWAAGAGRVGEGLSGDAMATAPFHPLLARYRAAVAGTLAHKAMALAIAALCAADLDPARSYVAEARTFFQKEADSGQEKLLALLEEMLGLLDADLKDSALDGPGISRVVLQVFDSGAKGSLPDIQRDYPRSALIGVLAIEAATSGANAKAEVSRARALLARFPKNAMVATDCVALLKKVGLDREAVTAWSAAQRARPDSPFLRGTLTVEPGRKPPGAGGKGAPGPGKQAGPTIPAIFSRPEEWAKALSAPIDVPADAAAVKRIENGELGFDAIIPASFLPSNLAASVVGFTHDDVNIGFMRVPRVTYCEGLACLDQLIPGLEQQGIKKQWRRALTTPIGTGAEAFFLAPTGALLAAAFPAGGYLYLIMAGGPTDRLAAELSAIRMAYGGFRPLDLVLPQPLARKLHPYQLADAKTLLRARALVARPTGRGCPLARLLETIETTATRRDLLLDAFLSTPFAVTRLRLLGCAPSDATDAAPGLGPDLTLAALWDEDRSIRRLGAAAVAANPAAVLTRAKSLLAGDKPIEPPAGSTGAAHDYRWTQLLLALPGKERGDLVRALLRRDEPHLRAVGLLAPHFGELEIGPEHLAILRDGPTKEARLALFSLPEAPGRKVRDAIWSRVDHARAPLASAEKDLLLDLASRLGKNPAPGDRPHLERLGKLVSAESRTGKGSEGVGDRQRVEALLRTRPAAPLPPREEAGTLAGSGGPLGELLPGRRWSYLRIPRPELMLSRLSRLARRLKASTVERQTLAQGLLTRIVQEAESAASDGPGVDLTRPVECASPEGNFGELVCAAALRTGSGANDIDQTLRAFGVLEGVTAGAVALPIVLPGLPFLLHQSVYAQGDPTRDGQQAALLRERAERAIDAPAGALTWVVEMRMNADGTGSLEDKIVLRTKERVFFSNSSALARQLFMPEGAAKDAPKGAAKKVPKNAADDAAKEVPRLGTDPVFRRLSDSFVEGADLTAIVMPGETSPAPRGAVALELTVTSTGVATRLRLPFRDQGPDRRLGALWRLLPMSPALGFGAADLGAAAEMGLSHPSEPSPMILPVAEGAGVAPPTWLAATTPAVAFAWYPHSGGRFWDGWLAAVGWDDKVAAAWRQHGMPPPPPDGKPALHDGYRFRLAGRALIVTNEQVLLDEASHKEKTEPGGAREEPVRGVFDGVHVAESLEDLAVRAPSREAGVALRTWAALTSVVKTATLGSTVSRDGTEVVIESLLTPVLQSAAQISLVDEWLAEPRIRNTLRLPRAIGPADAGKPLRFLLDVDRDQQVVRAFPATARQKLEQVAPGRWRLSVSPGPSLAEPVRAEPLSDADKRRWTDAGRVGRQIQSAANEIIPDKTPPKEAARLVLAWMKRNMTYELTPRDMSDEAILELRRGDCSEFSKLAVALLRAKGIPARTRSGFLADSGQLVAHAWIEFFDGTGWREIDPVNGTPSVDSLHLDASLVDVFSLLSLAQIRVAGIE